LSRIAGIELIAALLYAPGESSKINEEIKGITKLIKLIFLLLKESDLKKDIGNEFNYEAYDYGPFSSEVYDYLEMLKVKKMIIIKEEKINDFREIIDDYIPSENTPDNYEKLDIKKKQVEIYSLNELGIKFVEWLLGKGKIRQTDFRKISDFKKKYNNLSLKKLLKYVYVNYPKERERSLIIDDVLGYGKSKDLTPFERER